MHNGQAVARTREERKQADRKTPILNDPADWVVTTDAHESLISKELFDRVQQRMHSNKKRTGNNGLKVKVPYLLTGNVICGDCGNPMHGTRTTREKNGKVYEKRVYLCGHYQKSGYSRCHRNPVDADQLERTVGAVIVEMFSQDHDRIRNRLQRVLSARVRDCGPRRRLLQQKLTKMDADINRAADRLLKADDDLLDVLTPKLREMKQQRALLAREIDSIREPLASVPQLVEDAMASLDEFVAQFLEFDREALKTTFRNAIESVTVYFRWEDPPTKKRRVFDRGVIKLAEAPTMLIAGTGFEPAQESTGKTVSGAESGAESGALGAREAPIDPLLAEIVAAWPALPVETRTRIVAFIKTKLPLP